MTPACVEGHCVFVDTCEAKRIVTWWNYSSFWGCSIDCGVCGGRWGQLCGAAFLVVAVGVFCLGVVGGAVLSSLSNVYHTENSSR
jgi:hypothetical protein